MSPRPDLGPKPRLGYTASAIERMAERRADTAALAAWENDPRTRVYVVGGELVLLNKGAQVHDPLFTLSNARALGSTTELVFIGLTNGAARFAIGLDPASAEALKPRDEFVVTDLRSIAVRGLVEPDHLPPLAEGKALLNWHMRHRFCPNCGAPTRLVEAGWRRDCPSCRTQHFPRTDPVVIMLAIHGERCLLGRQTRFAKGMWSCLAGFVEPGETLEEAVHREVFEEVGIEIDDVRYHTSQPWPFPHSLMLGFNARYVSGDLVLQESEIVDAQWYDATDLPQIPPGMSIARRLIDDWIARR